MPRKKSDGSEGRVDEAHQDPLSRDISADDPSALPAEPGSMPGSMSEPASESASQSAPDPAGAAPARADEPDDTETGAETGTPAAETVDTAAVGAGEPAVGRGGWEPWSNESGAPPAPDLSAPEAASPDAGPPLQEPEAQAPHETELHAGPESDVETTPEPVQRPEPPTEPAAEPATEPAAAHRDAHEDDEDGGASVAAWALGIIVLLLAGAALGIWAGPKIAPYLPSGMKPVADWLEPGAAGAEAEIAAFRGELDGVEAKLGAMPSTADLDSRIGAAVSPVESRLSDEIATLRQSLDQTGGVEARQRLDALAAELQGQAAQLATLKTGLTGAAGEGSGDVNVFKADIEGLRAEVASLRDQVSAQASQLDEVAKSAEARVAAAEQQATEVQQAATSARDAAQARAQEALIRAAVASGAPYADAVAALETSGIKVPPDLAAGAQSGIATLASLRASFPTAAHAAIQASILAGGGDGIVARTNAFLRAQVASRSLTPQPGPGTDAILSRMEDKLRHDDLAGALAEADALPSEAAAAMSDWLTAAKLRLGATDGLAALSSSLPATN